MQLRIGGQAGWAMNHTGIASSLWARAKICDMWLTSSLPSSTACTLDLRSSSSSSSPSSFVDVPSASVPSVLWFDLIRRAPFVTQFGGLVGQRLRARERASTAMSPNIQHVHRHRSRCRRPRPSSTTPRPSFCYDSCCQLILKGVLLICFMQNAVILIFAFGLFSIL